MNIKYGRYQITGILPASLSIILLLCSVGYAWQLPIYRDYDEHPTWGKETNGVKAGLEFEYASSTNRAVIAFCPVLNNSSASNCSPDGMKDMWLYLPPFNSRYQMTLTDAKGMAVPKTAKCKALGQPINKPLRGRIGINLRAGYLPRILILNTPNEILYDPIDLNDYFAITNSGKYHLQFEVVVIWPSQKNPTNVVHLPPIKAEIEIKKL